MSNPHLLTDVLTGVEINQLFQRAHAIKVGHFVYPQKNRGWFHGNAYVSGDAVCFSPHATRALGKNIAAVFFRLAPEVIVSASTDGGNALAQWAAFWLNEENRAVSTERECGVVCADEDLSESGPRRVIGRGLAEKVADGKRCLIIEGVIDTGETARKTVEAVNRLGGKVIGIAALAKIVSGCATIGNLAVPRIRSFLKLNRQEFPEKDCHICRNKGVRTVDLELGCGRQFLNRIGEAPSD